jgi:hypothetical protein
MSEFYIVNEKRFPLPVETPVSDAEACNLDLLPYYRWEHRATIGRRGRRYMVFLDNLKQTAYIEDTTNGLEKIEDENLWKSIFYFATEKGFLMVIPPLMKPSEERFV